MLRCLVICLSAILTILCFITSCKRDSNLQDNSKQSTEKRNVIEKPVNKDSVIRDDKTADDKTLNYEDSVTVAQTESEETESDADVTDNTIYDVAEVLPEYPGGIGALDKFVQSKLNAYSFKGVITKPVRTMVSFVIEKDGTLTNTGIARTSGNSKFDAAAIEIVSAMPDWIPAMDDNKTIRMKYIVSVAYNPTNK